MILNIMIHKNKKIDCFTQPIFTDVEPEKFAIQESRSLQICKLEDTVPYKNLDLYFLGLFDDSTGSIVDVDENGEPLKRKILNCTEVIKKRMKSEGKEYVESISTNSAGQEA